MARAIPLRQEGLGRGADEGMIMQHLGSEVGTVADLDDDLMRALRFIEGKSAEFSKFKKFGLRPLHTDCFNARQALERTLNARPALKSRAMALLSADPDRFRTIASATPPKGKREKRRVQRAQVLELCEELVE
eukprot:1650618-Pyramimonas_sp.AAC.1